MMEMLLLLFLLFILFCTRNYFKLNILVFNVVVFAFNCFKLVSLDVQVVGGKSVELWLYRYVGILRMLLMWAPSCCYPMFFQLWHNNNSNTFEVTQVIVFTFFYLFFLYAKKRSSFCFKSFFLLFFLRFFFVFYFEIFWISFLSI